MGTVASSFDYNGKRCFRSLMALSAEVSSANEGWAHLATLGEWQGHPSGPFAFTPEVFAQILGNFGNRETPIKFDYEHQSLRTKSAGPIPASGHVKKLELRADGQELWGFVSWTDTAADMIRKREYTSCSAVVVFDATDRKTGKDIGAELIQAALTDDPFIDGLTPIQLTRMPMSETQMDPIIKKLSDPAAEKEAPGDAANDTENAADKAKESAMNDTAATQDDASAALDMLGEACGMSRAEVIQALLDNADPIVAALNKAKDKTAMSRDVDEKRFVALANERKDAQILALTARVAELEGAKDGEAEAKVKARVLELTARGHIGDGAKEQADALFLFSHDADRAERVYASPVCPVGKSQAKQFAATTAEKKPDPKRIVDLGALNDREQVLVRTMNAAGIFEQTTVARVLDLRAGKGN